MAEVEDIEELLNKRMTASTAATLLSDIKLTARLMPLKYWLERMNVSSAGVLGFPGNSAGQLAVTEASASQTMTNSTYSVQHTNSIVSRATVGAHAAAIPDFYWQPRIGVKQITLAGGTAGDQELVAALAGYYGVIQLVYMISDTSDTYTFAFQDSDNAALTGLMGGSINVSLTAQTISKTMEGAVLYKGTDNKALEVDVSGGAGAEVITIGYIYWYET